MKVSFTLGLFSLAFVGCTSARTSGAPEIDGIVENGEWRHADIYEIPSGGTVRVLREANNLYIAISAIETGFPTVFVGDPDTINVLHASAAQGSIRFLRSRNTWTPDQGTFTYSLRQDPDGSQASREMRDEFMRINGWQSTSDRDHGPNREFLVKLDQKHCFLAISFLGIPSTKIYGWPAKELDDTQNQLLLRGEVPPRLQFSPESWLSIGEC